MSKASMAMLTAMTAAMLMPSASFAEIKASAGVASSYLSRGVDQSGGNAQVFGDLTWASDMGFYTSVWASSYGGGSQQFDLIAGWEVELGDWRLNTGVTNSIYPGYAAADNLGAESEYYLGFAIQGFEAYLYKNIASDDVHNSSFYYFATGYSWKKAAFNLGYGFNNNAGSTSFDGRNGEVEFQYAHFDFTYAYTENLTFTFSQVIYRDAEVAGQSVVNGRLDAFGATGSPVSAMTGVKDNDLMVAVTYSLPLDL